MTSIPPLTAAAESTGVRPIRPLTRAQEVLRLTPEFEREQERLRARRAGKTVISSDYADYLKQQAMFILSNGGSEADVIRFFRFEGNKTPDLPPNPVPETEAPSFLRGISMRALQGISLGFGDEAMGALLGIVTGEGARAGIDTYRKELEAWSKKHKVSGTVAELAGGILSGGAIAGAARGVLGVGARAAAPTITQRVGLSALEGATVGAAFGAGQAEGGLSERSRAALWGGAIGGVLAGAVVPVGRVLGTVTRPVVRGLTSFSRRIQDALPGVGSPALQAKELMARALVQDGIDIGEAAARLTKLEGTNVPTTLADIGGDATLRLASEAVALRSPQKQQLIEMLLSRQSEQGERMTERLFQSVIRGNRGGMRNAYDAVDGLRLLRKEASTPYYQKAFQETVELTPRMQQIMRHPAFKKAYAIGSRIAGDEDLAGIGHGLKVAPLVGNPREQAIAALRASGVAEKAIPEGLRALGFAAEPALPVLPVRGLDYMKRGLDVVIQRATKGEKPSLDVRAAATLRKLMGEILEEADKQVPDYMRGRALWKGLRESEEAVTLGRDFLKKAPDIVKREMEGLSPFDKDFYRLGAAQALSEKVFSSTAELGNPARQYFGGRLFGTKNVAAERIKALFPDAPEAAKEFMRIAAAEARLSHTTTQVAMSAPRQSLAQAEEAIEGAIPQVRINMWMTGLNLARQASVRARTGWTQNVSDELALLFSRGMDGNYNALHLLLEELEGTTRTLGRRSAAATGVAAGLGLAGGAAGAAAR